MSSSAELRMPYLDRDLVGFVASLPTRHRVPAWPGKSNTKRVLRDWARSRLPVDVVGRSKKGFQVGSAEGLLRAIPGTPRDRVLGSGTLRRALPGLEAWVASLPEHGVGAAGPALWALLVLASWSQALGIQ